MIVLVTTPLTRYRDRVVTVTTYFLQCGVVGLLSFKETVRGDTAIYACTATSSLPETATLMVQSNPIPLVIKGECILLIFHL